MKKDCLRSIRLFLWILLVLSIPWSSSCTSEPPAGEPVDFEAMNRFKPFSLRSVAGDTVTLEDVLGQVTLVSFFFPT